VVQYSGTICESVVFDLLWNQRRPFLPAGCCQAIPATKPPLQLRLCWASINIRCVPPRQGMYLEAA
jgi:hypothetical protein